MSRRAAASKKETARRGVARTVRAPTGERSTSASAVMEEARRAGLLDGDATEHISFRAPRALVEAAKRGSGTTRPTELGLLALAMLAQPDPVAEYMKKSRGALGADHKLDY